jgi:hypothetical protein
MFATERRNALLKRGVRGVCMAALPALLLANTATVKASNLNFLDDTPMSYLEKEDIESIKRALIVVLNTKQIGEASRWTNDGTGNIVKMTATMTPESTNREGDRTCRGVAVVLVAKGQSMDLHPQFCGTGGTDWTLKKR